MFSSQLGTRPTSMGAAASVNKITQVINDSVNIDSSLAESACGSGAVIASSNLTLDNCPVDNSVIDMYSLVDSTCIGKMQAQWTNVINNDLADQLKQAAETSTSGIPGLTATVSVNVEALASTMATDIKTAIKGSCGDGWTASASNSFNCINNPGGINGAIISFKDVAKNVVSCTMDAVATSSAAQQLFTVVDEAATSTQAGLLGGITGIIILGIIVVGAVAAYKALNSKGGQQALAMVAQQQGGAKPPTGGEGGNPLESAAAAVGGDGCGCGCGPAATTGGDSGGGGKSGLAAFFTPTKFFIGGALICITLFIFYKMQWWPFLSTTIPVATTPGSPATTDAAKAQQEAAASRNKKILIGAIIAFIVCVLGAITTGIILPTGKSAMTFVEQNPQLLMMAA